ncbi:putative ecto-NOX disulfide-thiol exchanger 2-like isoform X3 [Apostichopus japonicus]|uniref:Putative ecto-NOX disulfide-thiol exchanger 2-like isoform X3 n=1 Tax=Stichopus japonicus TaxID=307972 RepID=A0A2G8KWB5_STIJA|nr:putative ecto-NOX disulfide-thiol exchanger 2-like isoform X3 [Apostichopus japonicus]
MTGRGQRLHWYCLLGNPQIYNNQARFEPHNHGNQGMASGPMMGHMGMQNIIHGNGYVVYPPDGTTSTPLPSERPVGCKTVIFAEVPFKVTGEMLVDLCERVAGSVDSFERSNGPFCQVRFRDQVSIDRIFSLHGMHICVNNNKSRAFSGMVLVDYVQNPNDLRDYELEQRRIMRELQHEAASEEIPIVDFTRAFIDEVTERIKGENIAGGCVNILITWLERGHCTKKTASTFYRLISLTNSHVKRLQNDKNQVEEIFNQARQQYVASKDSIVMQLTLIEQVFTSAAKKKVWDHFTKAQRKSLDQWSRAVKDLRSTEEKEIRPEEAGEADMELDSEDEDAGRRPTKQSHWNQQPPRPAMTSAAGISDEITEIIDLSDEEEEDEDAESKTDEAEQSVQEKDDISLEKRLVETPVVEDAPPEKRAKVNEPEITIVIQKDTEPVIRSEDEQTNAELEKSGTEIQTDEEGDEDKEISELRKENREMKAQLEALKREEASMKEKETQIKALQLAFVNMQQQLKEAKSKLKNEEENRKARELEVAITGSSEVQGRTTEPSVEVKRSEGALLSFICIFLHAHPFGASIDYLYSYLSRLHPNIVLSDIDGLLHGYPNCFVQELSGVGASLERRWKFVAFEHALKKS